MCQWVSVFLPTEPGLVAKSTIVLEVKPWDIETGAPRSVMCEVRSVLCEV